MNPVEGSVPASAGYSYTLSIFMCSVSAGRDVSTPGWRREQFAITTFTLGGICIVYHRLWSVWSHRRSRRYQRLTAGLVALGRRFDSGGGHVRPAPPCVRLVSRRADKLSTRGWNRCRICRRRRRHHRRPNVP